MDTGVLRCACCGRWKVRAVVLRPDPRRPEVPLLRVTHCGYLAGEYHTPEQVAAALAEAGVDFASLVEDAPPADPPGVQPDAPPPGLSSDSLIWCGGQ